MSSQNDAQRGIMARLLDMEAREARGEGTTGMMDQILKDMAAANDQKPPVEDMRERSSFFCPAERDEDVEVTPRGRARELRAQYMSRGELFERFFAQGPGPECFIAPIACVSDLFCKIEKMMGESDIPALVALAGECELDRCLESRYALAPLQALHVLLLKGRTVPRVEVVAAGLASRLALTNPHRGNFRYVEEVFVPTLNVCLIELGHISLPFLLHELAKLCSSSSRVVMDGVVANVASVALRVAAETKTRETLVGVVAAILKNIRHVLSSWLQHLSMRDSAAIIMRDADRLDELVTRLSPFLFLARSSETLSLLRECFAGPLQRSGANGGLGKMWRNTGLAGLLYDMGVEVHPTDPLLQDICFPMRRNVATMWTSTHGPNHAGLHQKQGPYPGEEGYVLGAWFIMPWCGIGSCCSNPPSPPGTKMLKCGGCVASQFCSKACQVRGWAGPSRPLCKELGMSDHDEEMVAAIEANPGLLRLAKNNLLNSYHKLVCSLVAVVRKECALI